MAINGGTLMDYTGQRVRHKSYGDAIRAEAKKEIPTVIKPFVVENRYVSNPITLIDSKISWFGMPESDANFVAEGRMLQTKYRPIIRFEGEHTARTLYSLMEMKKTTDQSETADADANRLSDYILAHESCPKCGKPMKMKSSEKRFFLGCSEYPRCNGTKTIDAILVERYLQSHEPTGRKCVQCGTVLRAMSGRYGVYIQCSGPKRHKYSLDSI